MSATVAGANPFGGPEASKNTTATTTTASTAPTDDANNGPTGCYLVYENSTVAVASRTMRSGFGAVARTP
jgi:hypothetical protein